MRNTAIPAAGADWAICYASYRCLVALRDADVAFGALADAKYARKMAIQLAETRCATRTEALAQREVKAANRALSAAEEHHHLHFGDPLQAAAIATVMAPAPDPDALDIKLDLVRRFELDNSRAMPRRPMEIVQEDADRLASIGAPDAADIRRAVVATDQAAAHLFNADQLAESIAPLISPVGHTTAGLQRAQTLLHLQMDELRRAADALGEVQ